MFDVVGAARVPVRLSLVARCPAKTGGVGGAGAAARALVTERSKKHTLESSNVSPVTWLRIHVGL